MVVWKSDTLVEKVNEKFPDAMILGNVPVESSEFEVVPGAGTGPDGTTSTFLYYAASPKSRIVDPEAIPVRLGSHRDTPMTPYETFVLKCIDGRRTVREIRRMAGLAVEEMVVTLLTLADKSVVELKASASPQEPSPPTGRQDFDDSAATAMVHWGDIEGRKPFAPPTSPNTSRRSEAKARPASSSIRVVPVSEPAPPRIDAAELEPLEYPEPPRPTRAPQAPSTLRPARERDGRLPAATPRHPDKIVVKPAGGFVPPRAEPKSPPSDPLMTAKAARLFEQALADKDAGNLVSARMNMKLALTFEPNNRVYARAFEKLSENPNAVARPPRVAQGRGRELYDEATEAEVVGDFDRAIACLERAIEVSPQAAFHNRLGVILAMRKLEFVRAQQLIERALELSPGSTVYEKNLQKILSMAATQRLRNGPKRGKSGFLSRLWRRR